MNEEDKQIIKTTLTTLTENVYTALIDVEKSKMQVDDSKIQDLEGFRKALLNTLDEKLFTS